MTETTTEGPRGFWRVKPDKYLHLPNNMTAPNGMDRLWLGPGGVVDLSDDFILECVKGQLGKLEPAPTAKAADPLRSQRLVKLKQEHDRAKSAEAQKKPEEQAADALKAKAGGKARGIQVPDAAAAKV